MFSTENETFFVSFAKETKTLKLDTFHLHEKTGFPDGKPIPTEIFKKKMKYLQSYWNGQKITVS